MTRGLTSPGEPWPSTATSSTSRRPRIASRFFDEESEEPFMATEISGRNYEIPPNVRDMVEKKLAKIEERLFSDVIDVRVVLQVEKYRNICEVIIVGKEHDVKTVQESDESMQDAINLAMDHLKRQAQKNRKKIRDHHRRDGNGRKSVTEWAVQVLEPGNLRESGEQNRPRI